MRGGNWFCLRGDGGGLNLGMNSCLICEFFMGLIKYVKWSLRREMKFGVCNLK